MARPIKQGFDYLPLDTVLNNQIEALEMVHGNDGFAWIVKCWQRCYQTGDGMIDLRGLFETVMAKSARITVEKQKEVINTCLQVGLLAEKEPGLYVSNGVIKRLQRLLEEREKDRNRKKNELSDGKQGFPEFSGIFRPKVKYSKAEKSKVKESKQDQEGESALIIPQHLVEIWPHFLEMRRKLRKPATNMAQSNIFAKLEKMSPSNHLEQIDIVNQSITNGWQDVFPLRRGDGQKPRYGRQEIVIDELRDQAIRMRQKLDQPLPEGVKL